VTVIRWNHGWKTSSASVTGAAHRAVNSGNDDAFVVSKIGNRALIVAVADGAGSAAHGGIGARVVVRKFAREAARCVSDRTPAADIIALLPQILQQTQRRLEQFGKRRGIELGDLASTLIVAIAVGRKVIFGQIGDGAIVILNDDGNLELVELAKHGEYAGETVFVTTPHSQFSIAQRPRVAAMALMTDGVEFLSINSKERKPTEGFFYPLFLRLRRYPATEISQTILGILNSPGAQSRSDDDLTLVVCAARTPSIVK
jgi:hypothetical protein